MDQRIDEDYKKVVRLKITLLVLLIISLPLLLMGILFLVFFPSYWGISWIECIPLIISIMAPLIALITGSIWASKWIANFSFVLEREGVRINSGVITKTQKYIPYKRIQDLSVTSGFWERKYGLSTIQIETAGAARSQRGFGAAISFPGFASTEGVIPGLKDPDPIAKEIRSRMGTGDNL